MGISLKDIFKPNEEELVVNRSAKAIKALIFMALGIVFLIIIAFILQNMGDKEKERREAIIHDIQVIRSQIENKANEYKSNPTKVSLIGTKLEATPIQLTVNGIIEEYRYGYYWLTPESLAELTNALLLPNESYIVNYDTYDVINYAGIVYEKARYHSLEDLLIVKSGMKPGTKEIIRTVADLEKIRANPKGYFKLSGNLDLSTYALGEGWEPIKQFSGTLDGRGYTISNLTIHRPSSTHVGLFGELTSTAKITNVKFENVKVTGGEYVGTLAGTCAGSVSHVQVTNGSVVGQRNYIGGLVGSQNSGIISNCIVKLDSIQTIDEVVGGIVGLLSSGTLTKSGVTTQILGRETVGGVVGLATVSEATYIKEVSSNVQLNGITDLGGLIGKIEILTDKKLELGDSYSKGTINGVNKNSGGLVGSISSVGDANIEFKSLYTTLDILEKDITSGGCIGYTNIAITSAVSFSDCFWEKDLAPGEELRSVGAKKTNTFTLSFDSKSYDEMRIRNTFANWDLKIWTFDERNSTPYLIWEM